MWAKRGMEEERGDRGECGQREKRRGVMGESVGREREEEVVMVGERGLGLSMHSAGTYSGASTMYVGRR